METIMISTILVNICIGCCGLLVQVRAVNDKNGLLNAWNLQKIACHLIAGQGLP